MDYAGEDTLADILNENYEHIGSTPAPYVWNAVLAYAADLGWGLDRGLSHEQYVAGQNLFRDTPALINVPFARGGPIRLPLWMLLPVNLWPGTQ